MATAEQIKNELEMGLRLLSFQSVKLEQAPLAVVDQVMRANAWSSITAPTREGNECIIYYYSTAMKSYARVVSVGGNGACTVENVEESDVLERLSFPELQKLGNMIDKKSVAFIRIYSDKELASAGSEEELRKLHERNQKMIDEAEVALRKR